MEVPSTSSIPKQQNRKIMEKRACNQIRPMAPQHPRAYLPTYQKDFAIFNHKILYFPTKRILIQAIKDGYSTTWPVLTERLISKYLPESDITTKGNLDHQKQLPVAVSAANVTRLSTKSGDNTSEVLLQLFDPAEKKLT